ncbi:TPA: undecaprenyldiphospho-muramoylpentapeptide beta-N-acetylglucosaminyltransferase [Candidatus Peregrinibacteria bacterium]|nr:MAG: UDP-diphospho-muramoylpentapeptide beta-N- acetylglucosaminyltransferase [Candidatus Peregrinibacteria bacterium GW2011_GWA2_43_8]HAU40030.1 undecaprenyldiphospho-muramoylpentapeptide beta-N-acetylglucosaminyltransferase [Candidatus Peregrinibacteria bacterium]
MRILLTGGGTAGHIIPNIAVSEELKKHSHDLELLYIGSKNELDKEIVESAGIKFKSIHAGKLRRYFSFENFVDMFKVPMGFFESFKIIKKFNPDIIFSKGGYVAVPVVLAGKLLKKKIIIHESDANFGLASRITGLFANKILTSYEETGCKNKKVQFVGCPIRPEVIKGAKEEGYKITGFHHGKPTILVMGGSLGAMKINTVVWSALSQLIPHYQIVHICGKGKSAKVFSDFLLEKLKDHYVEYEYVDKELKHFYAIADIIISRAGANSLAEIETTGAPTIIVPLPGKYSRGDQLENAKAFRNKDKRRYKIIKNEKLTSRLLVETINELTKEKKRPVYKELFLEPTRKIATTIKSLATTA